MLVYFHRCCNQYPLDHPLDLCDSLDLLLRSGHSLLTHGYLMDDNEPDVSPICEGCPNAVLSIKHILLQCLFPFERTITVTYLKIYAIPRDYQRLRSPIVTD